MYEKLATFNIKRLVGTGTYGKVYKAEHSVSGTSVALKYTQLKATPDKHSQRHNHRLEREIKLMSLLRHPHIARLYDVIQIPNNVVMVLEYISGCQLLAYIQSCGYLNEKEACGLFRQMISAVDYMHRNSIVHRDLKLGNIMIDRYNQIRIIDFGFADTFEWGKKLDTFCGSPCYASPEIICGIKYTGPEVDIWSLGVVLYSMLCGTLPFEGKSDKDIYAKISTGKFNIPSHLSHEAQCLIKQMIAVDPALRINMVDIVKHPWTNKFNAQPINNHMPARPTVVLNPNEQSLHKMPAYQYGIPSVVTALSRSDMALTPMVSIYHLLEESRRRKEQRNARITQPNMAMDK
ncbi:MAP/microtubule affinity-regulating kinase 4 [Coemansia sp. RSA 1822]|nr:MAP/microtubule affinity-regulating kinase 4 [Coemansia sp. RSA 638]KAJ2121638.1 MAP/microtubule affinity-regulating kinase 4 [Coemansia sp. RSA 720]KAJ2543250.1 MAP/microtubule affinity-regulating kinase 4 [Coemansia sp. RSA 1853]KAJ2563773.1 MAP/microtubule affinity-regulating kinase 4 [Coemansia sp. RSA 1822]